MVLAVLAGGGGAVRCLAGERATSRSPGPLVLDETADGKAISVALGRAIEINLRGMGSAGYGWALLKQVGHSVAAPAGPENLGSSGPPGSPNRQRFHSLAVKPGKSALTFVLRRPWEKIGADARRFSIIFEVQAEASANTEPALILGIGASGETFDLAPGDRVEVRLSGLVAEGASWKLVSQEGTAVKSLGEAVSDPAASGADVIRLQAVQPGTTKFTWSFLKPGEKKSQWRGVEIGFEVQPGKGEKSPVAKLTKP
jgi:predicted secreted protein